MKLYQSTTEFLQRNKGLTTPVTDLRQIVDYSQQPQAYKFLIETNGDPAHYLLIPVQEARLGRIGKKGSHNGDSREPTVFIETAENNLEKVCHEGTIITPEENNRRKEAKKVKLELGDHILFPVPADAYTTDDYSVSEGKVQKKGKVYLVKGLLARYLRSDSTKTIKNPPPGTPPQTTIDDDLHDDPEFQALTTLFLEKLPQQVGAIIAAIEKHDWDQVQHISHKLKGSGAAFGHPEISNIAKKINKLSTIDDVDKIPQRMKDAASSLQNYCNEILNQSTD